MMMPPLFGLCIRVLLNHFLHRLVGVLLRIIFVYLWTFELRRHSDFVTAIDFHPLDDKLFISGSIDGRVRLWNVPDQKVIAWQVSEKRKWRTFRKLYLSCVLQFLTMSLIRDLGEERTRKSGYMFAWIFLFLSSECEVWIMIFWGSFLPLALTYVCFVGCA